MLTNYGVIDELDNWTIFCKSVGYRDWTSFEFDEFRKGCDVFGKEKKRKKDEFVQVCGKLIERKRERHEIARRRREGEDVIWWRELFFPHLSSPISLQHSRLRRHLTSYIYYSPLSYRFSINLLARSALLLSANLSHIRMLSTTYIYPAAARISRARSPQMRQMRRSMKISRTCPDFCLPTQRSFLPP